MQRVGQDLRPKLGDRRLNNNKLALKQISFKYYLQMYRVLLFKIMHCNSQVMYVLFFFPVQREINSVEKFSQKNVGTYLLLPYLEKLNLLLFLFCYLPFKIPTKTIISTDKRCLK